MEFKILLQFLRLMGAIALEGLTSLFHMARFLLRRRAERERVFALILHKDPGPAVAAVAAVLLGALALSPLCGCSSAPPKHVDDNGARHVTFGSDSYPGTSFNKQVEELRWSTEKIAGMPGAQKSLEEDLEVFGSGNSPEEAASDAETILTDPGGQKSMEEDLEVFGSSEPGALMETLRMLGF